MDIQRNQNEPNLSRETITRVHDQDSQHLVSASYQTIHGDHIEETQIVTPFMPQWASNVLEEYEGAIKKASYIAIAVLCVFVAIGYVYSQPGSTVQIKWKRSFRKLKRLSKTSLPSFKEAAPSIYPFVKDFVHVAHVLLNHIFD